MITALFKSTFEILKKNYYKAQFEPTILSIFINPSYFIRRDLFNNISILALKIQGSILDFGCGRKPYQNLFTNSFSYIGLDLDHTDRLKNNVFADLFYDGVTIPIEDYTIDNIFSSETFELLPDPNQILCEFNRILKPGGKLLITVPFVWEEHWRPYDNVRYTEIGIKNLLQNNGFEILESRKSTSYFASVLQLFITYLWRVVFPNNKLLKGLFTILLISPFNLLGIIIDFFSQKNSDSYFYLNTVVLAHKKN